jgi:hypothetical protein
MRKSSAPFAYDLSGDFLSPSPPAEKTTARQDQAGQSGTGDRSRHGSYGTGVSAFLVTFATSAG